MKAATIFRFEPTTEDTALLANLQLMTSCLFNRRDSQEVNEFDRLFEALVTNTGLTREELQRLVKLFLDEIEHFANLTNGTTVKNAELTRFIDRTLSGFNEVVSELIDQINQ